MQISFISKIHRRYFHDLEWNYKETTLFKNGLNKKHKTITFDYKKSTILDTMVYKHQQHKIQSTIFRKPTYKQTYLHAESNHPKSLKDSISYSQALRIKTICSTTLNSIKTVRSLQKDSRKEVNPRIW